MFLRDTLNIAIKKRAIAGKNAIVKADNAFKVSMLALLYFSDVKCMGYVESWFFWGGCVFKCECAVADLLELFFYCE
ncbi:hypothetical protein D3C78_952150 [compost metagenome]